MFTIIIYLCLLIAVNICKRCDVLDYGAVGDGVSNDTIAILSAIKDCAINSNVTSPPHLIFPSNHSFKTWPFIINASSSSSYMKNWSINGAKIELQFNTMIINGGQNPDLWPSQIEYPYFISLSNLNSFELFGQSTPYKLVNEKKSYKWKNVSIIDGVGYEWWKIRKNDPHQFSPKLIYIENCINCKLYGLTIQNSPNWHLPTVNNINFLITNLSVMAPKDSPNTDAIDIYNSSHVTIVNNYLSEGDDNIAIQSGSNDITIKNVFCGSGHGTSIGSLGRHNSTQFVYNVLFENIIYNFSDNVARIKTWQGGSGYVKNITYRNITFIGVQYPIKINQYYCPQSQNDGPCNNYTSAVKIEDIFFENFSGTQRTGYAGDLWCADSYPCNNIQFKNINISSYDGVHNQWSCWQVYNSTTNNVIPMLQSAGNCEFN